jgi:uncharacterized protein (TIGR03437 family)
MSTDTKVRLVDLVAVVGPGIPTAAEKEPAHQAAGCVPARLIPVVTSHTSSFSVPAGLALPLETRVLDDCGDPMTEGAVIVSLAPGAQAPVALVHLGSGRWSGTLQVQGGAGPVTATFTADDPVRTLQGSFALTGEATVADAVPVISDGGVVSAASFARGAPLAPGGIFSVFGPTGSGRLADGSTQATTFPVPTQLGSTRVAIAGREVPLYFAGEQSTFSQVNAMLPFDLVPNTSYQLSVRRGNRRSNYAEVMLAASQPYVFTADGSGSGQGSVVDGANQTVLVNSANPVTRGGVVVIYLEGLGAVNRAVVPGEPSPATPPAQAVAPVTVTIGGQPSQILFAGLTPGLAGLFQINATVAETVTPGNAVPVVVTTGGQASVPVTIAVR